MDFARLRLAGRRRALESVCSRARRRAGAALALFAGLLAVGAAGAGEAMRAPLQVLAAAPLADAFREINVLDWCGKEPRAELYLADSATIVALALRGERADVVAAAGAAPLEPLVAAGRLLPPQRFAVRGGVEYWIAPLRDARDPATAQAFVEAVRSPRGQEALRRRVFAAGGE